MDNKKQLDGLDIEKVNKIAEHYEAILSLLGEDTSREGLVKTPMRAAKAMAFLTSGYRKDADKIVKSSIFHSLCEHHILPFFGKIAIGYIPDGNIVGLSKIARAVDVFARRLQVQERMTRQICDLLTRELSAKGVIVFCEATHMCMRMRGVEKECSTTQTIEYSGVFEKIEYRQEFLSMLKQ